MSPVGYVKQVFSARRFVCYAYRVGWWSWSFGVSFDPSSPNLEIHLPVFFIRVGWRKPPEVFSSWDAVRASCRERTFGYDSEADQEAA
jgi:hypothetical protein